MEHCKQSLASLEAIYVRTSFQFDRPVLSKREFMILSNRFVGLTVEQIYETLSYTIQYHHSHRSTVATMLQRHTNRKETKVT